MLARSPALEKPAIDGILLQLPLSILQHTSPQHLWPKTNTISTCLPSDVRPQREGQPFLGPENAMPWLQGVYGYGMDIGIIEPALQAAPLHPEASPAAFPQQFSQTTPSAPPPDLQLSARGMQPEPPCKQVLYLSVRPATSMSSSLARKLRAMHTSSAWHLCTCTSPATQ